MKKIFASLLALSMMLVGCGGGNSDKKDDTPVIALVTDQGNINDKSFNQSAWEAVEKYGKEKELGYKYYKPATFDTAGYTAQIESAVDNGAKVIVCPGFKFSETIANLQGEYPDVKFILIDATPADASGNAVEPKDNVYCALYKEQQPGYLAGYAAVKEGYTKLGFMGGIALPAVINFGYGYLQGANDAAKELNTQVEVKYTYTGTFNESPDIKTKAAGWYNTGTEVIFSCGGAICNSIFAAADEAGKMTIGVDSDQKDASKTVLTSATKGVNKTVYDELTAVFDNTFKGGIYTLDAAGNYVGLPEDLSRFKNFTKEDYDKVFDNVKNDTVKIISNADVDKDAAGDPNTKVLKTALTNVTVTYEK